MLNPEQDAFCVGGGRAFAMLPIRINQTEPVLIELQRIALDSKSQETISITHKEIRKLRKQASKELATRIAVSDPQVLRYPVKQPGLYHLHRVLDVSKLEVQRRSSEALVVMCPTAAVLSVPQDRCKGELSNFYLEVNATPPFNIKYSKTINEGEHTSASLSINPEHFVSPLVRKGSAGVLMTLDSANLDVSWARMQTVRLSVNETFGRSGLWDYSIDEVVDACGNVIDYSRTRPETSNRGISRSNSIVQKFVVRERPRAALDGCNPQNPLKVMKGKSALLPIRMISAISTGNDNQPYTVSYLFTPQDEIIASGEHANDAKVKTVMVSHNHRGPEIQEAGLYTLQTIKSRYCLGEILEPASCLLLNPHEPDLAIRAEAIPDACAGSSIGLLVDLELVGTPPFIVTYIIRHQGYNTPKAQVFDTVRSRIELKPLEAGDYRYEFIEVSDSVYVNGRSLKHKSLILEQSVRPPASAKILHGVSTMEACIEEPVLLDLQLTGEAPWNLEYELVRGGQRSTQNINVQKEYYTLMTEKLKKGGDYALGLTSVTDRSGCKVLLKEEVRIQVRQTRPTAAFGHVEGKLKAFTLESKKINLPVKLNGEPPWTISYRNLNEPEDKLATKQKLQYRNDIIEVDAQGVFQMTDISDASCPGSVDPSANKFQVLWIERPAISVVESTILQGERNRYIKKDVCEGDEDSMEISLKGTPPYEVKYERHFKPDHGPKSLNAVDLTPGLNLASIQIDTSQAGFHEYKFTELGDHYYAHDRRKFTPLTVQQRVQPRPSARFVNAGKTYSYCKEEEAGDEVIKIMLMGSPPFHLEVGIRHHATTKPEIINIPNVATHSYDFHIPHRVLALGTHVVTIRKIRDSRGCEKLIDFDGPHVQVNVADVPTISPLETTEDYCVGDRISYVLSGTPPFNVFYTFQGVSRKAATSTTTFRRLAETPGIFTITAISDQKSTEACKARVEITKVIHEMPSVRISKGRTAVTDIHEGGEAEILFEFGGTPPFEFMYGFPQWQLLKAVLTSSQLHAEYECRQRKEGGAFGDKERHFPWVLENHSCFRRRHL